MIGQAQPSKLSFEGVYTLENPSAMLILKNVGDGFKGYISDGQNAYKVAGEMNTDYLRLTRVDDPEKLANYLALDEMGNLLMTDAQMQVIYFTRSTESADELIANIEMEQDSIKPELTGKSGIPGVTISNHTNRGKYANKKFLHLFTGNGLSEKWAYYLYDHGGFYFRSSNSFMSDDAYTNFSAVESSNDAGKWNVETKEGIDYLVLSWNSGEQVSLKIQKAELGYLLNGEKYYLVGLEEFE